MIFQRFSMIAAGLCVLAMINDSLAGSVMSGSSQVPFDTNIFVTAKAIFAKKRHQASTTLY
jgi:hypothetical protein